ncbi:MAG: aldo/keto reductase [Polyangiaceae bacterium]|nr:aldo/keto reductase [Polyangiaceae bacterium]
MQTRRLGADGPEVSAIALGGMLLSITGRPPEDQSIAVIHAALDAGISLIDTADAYSVDERDASHNEKLIAKALRGRRARALVGTKVGCRRPGGAWTVDARPDYLVDATHRCLESLSVDAIDLVQLHAPDIRVPFEESVGALARLREQGKVRYVGVCNVTVEQVERARKVTPIACVQNRWNVNDRRPETDGILDHCTTNGLAFLAYSPFGGTLGAPSLGTHGRIVEEARRRRVSAYRLLLAWMVARCPVAIPIAGARRVESIEDSAAAGNMILSPTDARTIEATLKA